MKAHWHVDMPRYLSTTGPVVGKQPQLWTSRVHRIDLTVDQVEDDDQMKAAAELDHQSLWNSCTWILTLICLRWRYVHQSHHNKQIHAQASSSRESAYILWWPASSRIVKSDHPWSQATSGWGCQITTGRLGWSRKESSRSLHPAAPLL